MNVQRRSFYLLALLAVALPISGEEVKPTGSFSCGFLNNYVSRGYRVGQNSLVIQPSLTAAYQGWSFNLFANYDTDQHTTPYLVVPAPGTERKGVLNECDATLAYSRTFGKMSVTGGWSYFGYGYAKQTQELFVSGTYDTLLKPTLAVYRDIAAYPGTYVNLSISHSLALADQKSIDLSASMGYEHGGSGYLATSGKAYRALHDGMVKVGMTLPFKKHFVFQPLLQYWVPLSSAAKKDVLTDVDANPFGKLENTFVCGATLTMNF